MCHFQVAKSWHIVDRTRKLLELISATLTDDRHHQNAKRKVNKNVGRWRDETLCMTLAWKNKMLPWFLKILWHLPSTFMSILCELLIPTNQWAFFGNQIDPTKKCCSISLWCFWNPVQNAPMVTELSDLFWRSGTVNHRHLWNDCATIKKNGARW